MFSENVLDTQGKWCFRVELDFHVGKEVEGIYSEIVRKTLSSHAKPKFSSVPKRWLWRLCLSSIP